MNKFFQTSVLVLAVGLISILSIKPTTACSNVFYPNCGTGQCDSFGVKECHFLGMKCVCEKGPKWEGKVCSYSCVPW